MDIGAGAREPIIKLTAICKWFGAYQALCDINLAVAAGERVVVCGPSGSGKSTMIRCINGLEHHQQGSITVNGQPVLADGDGIDLVRRTVGMVFQSFNIFPHLSVLDNVSLAPRKLRRMSRADAEALANRLLERVHIAQHGGKLPSQLSGGQLQRVAIARALAMEPQIMLFDEPTSSLDPEMVKEVLDVMIALANSGMTMICVTHETGFARAVADRVVFMHEGRIVESAPPADFFARPASEQGRHFVRQCLH